MGKFEIVRKKELLPWPFPKPLPYRFWITVNRELRSIVLSCRGTDWRDLPRSKDVLTDLLALFISPKLDSPGNNTFTDLENGAFVHLGFWVRFLEYRSDLVSLLEQLFKEDEDFQTYSMVVSGHSLGAATALIMAAYLKDKRYNVAATYLYGMPYVGNQAFVDAMVQKIGPEKVIRVVNGRDIVPHLGAFCLGNHTHHGYKNLTSAHPSNIPSKTERPLRRLKNARRFQTTNAACNTV